ncbi:UNVERIFIED_CONTAM: hypothetical protein FKN15_010451 [Acipenser sinensis]
MMFRDQVGILTDWFKGWNECEQTVALLSLLKRVTRTQARFLQICLEHSLSDCTEIHILEAEANNAAIVSQWYQEPKENVVSLLLSHLPLLQPRNAEAKCEYMLLLQKVLMYTIESNLFVEESRQLLSYALIHPATTVEDRTTLAMWLNHLEEHLSSGYSGRASSSSFSSGYHPRQGSDEWTGGQSEIVDPGHVWQDKPATAGQNGHMPFHVSTSVPSAMNSIGSSTNTAIVSQWYQEPKEKVVSLLLSHLPLLQPRNAEAKCEYMLLLQKVLTYTIESNLFVEESRQLLSYALIHPATTVEDRTTLAMWLNHLEEHLSSGYSGRASSSAFSSGYHPRQGSDEWTGGQSEIVDPGHVWQDKPATAGQNGHMPFHVSTSVPSAMNSIGSSANTVLSSQIHPSPLKRSMSLVPTSLQLSGSDWTSQEDLGIRGSYVSSDHAPLSPQRTLTVKRGA